MNKLLLAVLLASAVIFSSCSFDSDVDDGHTINKDVLDVSDKETDKDDDKNYESGTMTINVFENDEPVDYVLNPGDEIEHRLKVYYSRDNLTGIQDITIPVNLYLIRDGEPIAFSVDGSEKSVCNPVAVKLGADNYYNIEFDLEPGFQTLSLLTFDLSDSDRYFRNVYSLCYTMVNSDGAGEVYKTEIDEHRVKMDNPGLFGLGFSEHAVEPADTSLQISNIDRVFEVERNADESELFAQFGCGKGKSGKYYVMMFCDGNIIRLSGDEYSILMDCGESEYLLDYPVKELLSDGLHGYYLAAVKADYSTEGVFSQGSYVSGMYKVETH